MVSMRSGHERARTRSAMLRPWSPSPPRLRTRPGSRLPSPSGEVLAVEGLRRRLGGREAVAGFHLALAPGEVHGLAGPNGAGKSTVLRLLSGLLACDDGRGRVLGFDLRREPRRVAAQVGYMAQRLALHAELTVAETLRFRAEVYGIARPRAALAGLVERLELGRWLKTRAGALSGGWARRLQLAAALVHAPRLLLLDEPTAGLDHEAQRALWREIGSRAEAGAAVLINTHDPSEAERCARVTVLADGAVRARGAPAALLAQSGVGAWLVSGAAVEAWLARAGLSAAAERWGGGFRIVERADLGEKVAAAARSAGLACERQAPRLEHAWPALVAKGAGTSA